MVWVWCQIGVGAAGGVHGRAATKIVLRTHPPAHAFCHSSCRVRCSAAPMRAHLLSGAQGVTGRPPPPRASRKKIKGRAGDPCPVFGAGGVRGEFFFFFFRVGEQATWAYRVFLSPPTLSHLPPPRGISERAHVEAVVPQGAVDRKAGARGEGGVRGK